MRNKIILDLCGGTGSWSRPYKVAGGYTVINITLPDYDVRKALRADRAGEYIFFPKESETPGEGLLLRINEIYGILAAPPCTEFSILNCKAEPRERDELAGMEIVQACRRIIGLCEPIFWAMENPRGFLRKYLGEPKLSFQPWWYGDAWTKATDIWGSFNIPERKHERWEDVPKLDIYTRPNREKPNFAFLHKSAWNNIPQLHYHKPETDAEFRAMTPPGFAQAFFEANK